LSRFSNRTVTAVIAPVPEVATSPQNCGSWSMKQRSRTSFAGMVPIWPSMLMR
jgi:hypothetical protein